MSTAAPWYAMDALPPGRAKVRVFWAGREFVAMRALNPNHRLQWCVVDGLTTWLPRPDDRERWGSEPECWQPERPEIWTWPGGRVPEALPDQVQPRMWSSRSKFAAVEDAEAADLAREMERDRSDAHRERGIAGGDPSEPAEQQWWRDPFLVTYSAPGSISLREVEGRLMRALAAEWWVRPDRPSEKTFAAVLAAMSKTLPLPAGELAASEPIVLRAEPTGRDRDDMATALGWLIAVTQRREWQLEPVLRFRADDPPLSWRQIGRKLSVSHETARTLYSRALGEVHREANGHATEGGVRTRARLDAVQRANRRHKISAGARE